MNRTTVSTKGRVVLPKAIREKRRWVVGTELVVEERAEGILLKPVEKKTKKTRTIDDLIGILKLKAHRAPSKR